LSDDLSPCHGERLRTILEFCGFALAAASGW